MPTARNSKPTPQGLADGVQVNQPPTPPRAAYAAPANQTPRNESPPVR